MSLSSFATLDHLGPTVTTGEAAAALRVSVSQASRLMRSLERKGLARNVRYGLWIVGSDPVDPRTLIEELTRPYPAYLSFTSALSAHGMIDQVPREISVASLDSAKRIRTELGTYAVHHLPPELFGGWDEGDSGFDRDELDRWLSRIESPRVRTLTSRGIRYALTRAVR